MVKEEGNIIMVWECGDGFGDDGKFGEMFKMGETGEGIVEVMDDGNFKEMDEWEVQKEARIERFGNVYV
nr:hypothetical protein [Staphylococcus capitis]